MRQKRILTTFPFRIKSIFISYYVKQKQSQPPHLDHSWLTVFLFAYQARQENVYMMFVSYPACRESYDDFALTLHRLNPGIHNTGNQG